MNTTSDKPLDKLPRLPVKRCRVHPEVDFLLRAERGKDKQARGLELLEKAKGKG
jgi:hypothetical protein